MKELLIATANPHKAEELEAIIPDLGIKYLTLRDFPDLVMPEENGATLDENAVIKARGAAVVSGRWTLADDTGLEVDALNGEPGVLSARYAGTERDYAANNKKLLEKLSDVAADKRTARFRCVMALVSPDGKTVIKEEGKLEGFIIASERGTNGFGYDPLFTPVNSGSTLAQLSAEEKNGLSHRFNAVRAMVPHIKRLAAG